MACNLRWCVLSVLTLGVAAMQQACVTSSDDSEGFAEVKGQGDAWQFENCKKRALEGMEIVETQNHYKVFRKASVPADGNLELIFTDEFGEEYTLKGRSDKKNSSEHKTVWTGKSILANAVDLDSKPFMIAFEVEKDGSNKVINEIITTKVEVPREYFDEDVTKAFEVNKYSSKGDSITMVLLQTSAHKGFDHVVTRVCGSGFSKAADSERKPLPASEFAFEAGL